MMIFEHGETVVRIRRVPGGRDPYGDPIGDTEDRLEIHRCSVAPRQAGELIAPGRIAVADGLTVYAPPDADIRPSDRLEVRGEVYEVDGEPGLWHSPLTGWTPGLEIRLTRIEEGAA